MADSDSKDLCARCDLGGSGGYVVKGRRREGEVFFKHFIRGGFGMGGGMERD